MSSSKARLIFTARIRRMGEGNVFSLSTLGGVPISHNALQHFPECHGAAGGVPCQVQPGGVLWLGGRGCTLAGGVPWLGGYPGQVPPPARSVGGYPSQGGTQVRYPPARSVGGGVPWPGLVPRSGTPPRPGQWGGYPVRTT